MPRTSSSQRDFANRIHGNALGSGLAVTENQVDVRYQTPAPCPDSPGGGGSREHAATSLLQPLPPSLRPSGLSGPPGGSNDPTVAIFNWGPVCCHVFVFCSLSCKILNSTTFKRNPAPLLTPPKTDKSPRKVRKPRGSAGSIIFSGRHGVGIINLKRIAHHDGSAVSTSQFTEFDNLSGVEILANKLQSGSINLPHQVRNPFDGFAFQVIGL